MPHYHPAEQHQLSRDQLEELLTGKLPGDDTPAQPIRKSLERRRDEIATREATAARRSQETDNLDPRELAKQIPRR